MDSMPIRVLPTTNLENIKIEDRSDNAQHVENIEVASPIEPEANKEELHLPKGISETDEERLKHWFIGSVDCGTTSSRFLIFNGEGTPVASHQIEFENIYPESGHHEHKPQELVDSVEECIDKAVADFEKKGYKKSQIKTIGLTTQRETTICWDTETGEPLYNAIVWPDTRTTSIVRELKAQKGSEELLQTCGLPISTYPSSLKLLWMLRNVDAIKKAYDEGRLSFGTVDTWLIYKLNGGKEAGVHVTDTSKSGSDSSSKAVVLTRKSQCFQDHVHEHPHSPIR